MRRLGLQRSLWHQRRGGVSRAQAKLKKKDCDRTVASDTGQRLNMRISNATDIEGVPDRSHLKVGMGFSALYEEQKERNETLEIKVER